MLGEIHINPTCRVRRIRVAAAAAAAVNRPAAPGGAAGAAGASSIRGGGLQRPEDPLATFIPRPLAIGNFCVHLLANSPGKGLQSFILSFNTAVAQTTWFNELHKMIRPQRPAPPPKNYPKGLNNNNKAGTDGEDANSDNGTSCVVS